jgi:DNA-binding response OmpR family regulator
MVEDEAPNRALLRAVLDRADEPLVRQARVIEAEDLATARRLLDAESVDLILLDVRLPDGSGLELAQAVHDRQAAERPAVIVLSASVLRSQRDTALAAGADHFVSKPFVPSDLTALIAAELARKMPPSAS